MSSFKIVTAAIFLAVLAGPAGAADRAVPATREQVTLTFAPVVKRAAPAVVNIYTRKVVHNRGPFGNDPFFQKFFGENSPFSSDRVQNSLGSGVIVRSTGVVVTNNHVAGDADEITVVLSDRREFAAKVVGKDERSDLAVLQLQNVSETLPALDMANSDDAEVGDLVLAIGNPFGVGQTVTSGIISGLARTTIGVSDFRSFIQTDAAINPGNSGGALITSDGRLIGINTAIYSQSGGNIGLGFAIPTNMARTVVAGILKEGKAVHAWLGASGKTVTADLAKSLALPRPTGIVIDRVIPASPADRAGLEVGDIVRTVNGREVHDTEEFRYLVATLPLSGKMRLGALRKNAERAIEVALEAPPDKPARMKTTLAGQQPFAGATVANLNPALAEEIGREYSEPGVIIIDIRPGSTAARLGFQAGDLIWAIGDKAIKSVEQVREILAQPTAEWLITLNRNGQAFQFRVAG